MTKRTIQRAMRINARLTSEEAAQLEYLVQVKDRSVTEVVRESIARYYNDTRAMHAVAAQALARTGFVGGANGPADLSTNYKKQLKESLATKHGHR